jgi:uncharacterized phage-associated protein
MTTKSTAKAMDVARYLIALAGAEEEPELLTPMRLQKLLYYTQGWSLALRDCPIFPDRIEAWAHGPVVEGVYHEFKALKGGTIPLDQGSVSGLSEEEQQHVQSVWRTYRTYSAIALSDMTHEESPWKDARSGLSREAKSNREITTSAMAEYFKKANRE